MNNNYVAEIQSTSIPDEQLVSGDMCPSIYICIRIQVARPEYMFPGGMCPGVNVALQCLLVTFSFIPKSVNISAAIRCYCKL